VIFACGDRCFEKLPGLVDFSVVSEDGILLEKAVSVAVCLLTKPEPFEIQMLEIMRQSQVDEVERLLSQYEKLVGSPDTTIQQLE